MFYAYEDLITIEDLCDILHIGKNAAYRLLSEGELKSFRLGRVWKIPKIALMQFITEKAFL